MKLGRLSCTYDVNKDHLDKSPMREYHPRASDRNIYNQRQGEVSGNIVRKKKVKSLEELEEEWMCKIGKKTKRKGKMNKKRGSVNRGKTVKLMANESLSDGDFRDVRRLIDEDAKATWKMGKMLGC